eukprot:gene7120-2660_t
MLPAPSPAVGAAAGAAAALLLCAARRWRRPAEWEERWAEFERTGTLGGEHSRADGFVRMRH